MTEIKKSFLSQLRDLQVGESITQPINRRSYVAVAATRFGVEWEKKFSISSNRDTRTVIVTRTA